MNNRANFRPDHWLICSPIVYASISDHWSRVAGEHALLPTRLRQGWVERVEPEHVISRVTALAAQRCHTVVLVFDHVDASAASVVAEVVDKVGDAIDLRVVDWLASTLEALVGMNCPDQALLDVLQGMPAAAAPTTVVPGTSPMASLWWPDYERALLHWEQTARTEQPEEFAQTYPHHTKQNIPWRWLCSVDWVAHGNLQLTEPANDWSWVEIPLQLLAASTPSEPTRATRLVPEQVSAERWSLSRYPIVGQNAIYLMFETESDSIARYMGCRIQVLAEGSIYELGQVNDDGVAELRVEGTVDISHAVVRIGKTQYKE